MSNALYLRLPAISDAALTGYRGGAAPAACRNFRRCRGGRGRPRIGLAPGPTSC